LGSSVQPTPGVLNTKGYGTGRRKNAVARVFIRQGSGKFEVNGRAVDAYFKNVTWLNRAIEPLKFTNTGNELDVTATCNGGGVGGQAGAVRMGLSRALSVLNPDLRHGLRKNGFLTRDSRMRERKKYGQKGARKRFQFSKR
jgi:small subunit ribosomal protein S9